MSHPSRVCGLKFSGVVMKNSYICVTPFAGVWVEISPIIWLYVSTVTPFAGVWVEIDWHPAFWRRNRSHTLRGCVG